jgi:hypothetical protein
VLFYVFGALGGRSRSGRRSASGASDELTVQIIGTITETIIIVD